LLSLLSLQRLASAQASIEEARVALSNQTAFAAPCPQGCVDCGFQVEQVSAV